MIDAPHERLAIVGNCIGRLEIHRAHNGTHVRCGRKKENVLVAVNEGDATCGICATVKPPKRRKGRKPQKERASDNPKFTLKTSLRISAIEAELSSFIGEVGDGPGKDKLFEAIGLLADVVMGGARET